MTPVPGNEYLERFRHALRLEVKAEMGRRDLTAHALAQLIGVNPQYINMRILSPNKKTGRFVDINVSDLFAIAGALDLDAGDLIDAATAAIGDDSHPANPPSLADKRRQRRVAQVQTKAAREDHQPRPGE